MNVDEVFNALSTQLGTLRLPKQDHIFIERILSEAKKQLTPETKEKEVKQ